MDRKQLGDWGEEIARKYLLKNRYKILDLNFENKWGEIDIVTKKKGVIIFCEVKTIIEKQGFFPEDQVDFKKKQQLRKMSQIYLSQNKISLETPCQIDIIAITIAQDLKTRKIIILKTRLRALSKTARRSRSNFRYKTSTRLNPAKHSFTGISPEAKLFNWV